MEILKEKSPKCPFFNVCGAAVVRQLRGENWYERYCFNNFEDCVHFKGRNESLSSPKIPQEGEKNRE